MSEVASLLARAAKYLDSAQLLLDAGDNESSVSRTYYAMFFAAEALLLNRGLTFSSHKAVISAFGEQFIKPGLLPREHGRELNRAFAKRQLCDYEYTFVVMKQEAEELLVSGREFLAAAVKLLRASGSLSD